MWIQTILPINEMKKFNKLFNYLNENNVNIFVIYLLKQIERASNEVISSLWQKIEK